MDQKDFFSFWKRRIEQDLTPFADPGTPVPVETSSVRSISAAWTARGEQQEAQFLLSLDEGIRVRFQGRLVSYKSFLADSSMADLFGLARMIQQARSRSGLFIPTAARRGDGEEGKREPALELLQRILDEPEAGLTRVLMVTGDAGAGKTRVLQQLVAQQAIRYLSGKTDRLYLYVNAQGRALARFNEALATELQDLRARLTYHAVSAVVRAGLLVPIIDGFDELLGMGGYEDAFSSLAGFIDELAGDGQIVASARSAYYEQEFVSRAESAFRQGDQAWSQTSVEVEPWDEAEFTDYVRGVAAARSLAPGRTEEFLERARTVFHDQNAALLHKPLFIAKTVDLLIDNVNLSTGVDLLTALVTAYLQRERTEKLLARTGGSLLTDQQLQDLFAFLAEEMWNQETRELDSRSVSEVAEFVLLDSTASEGARQIVVSRMAKLAFLTTGSRPGWIRFEHELFFSYFLSLALERRLAADSNGLRAFPGRSILPDAAVTTMLSRPPGRDESWRDHAERLLKAVAAPAGEDGLRAPQVRENAGLIAREVIKRVASKDGDLSGFQLRNVVIPGGSLAGLLFQAWTIERVDFRRVDLRGTRFVSCTTSDVLFVEPLLDPGSTRLELGGFDSRQSFRGVRILQGREAITFFAPDQVASALRGCGAPLPPASDVLPNRRLVSQRVVSLVERLARAYVTRNPVCTADDNLASLFKAAEWREIERALLDCGLVTREQRQTGGTAKTFLRRKFLPPQLMDGLERDGDVTPAVRRFWDRLEVDFPRLDE